MKYQKLFDYMSKEHGVTLLESDMQEIVKCLPNDWISVDDRLPENGTDILAIIFINGKYHVPFSCTYDGIFYNEDSDANYGDWSHTVTHWMPLPKPPKE